LHLITLTSKISLGRTPVDKGPACRIDLYLTTHNIHKRCSCLRQDLIMRSQQASSCRLMP